MALRLQNTDFMTRGAMQMIQFKFIDKNIPKVIFFQLYLFTWYLPDNCNKILSTGGKSNHK